MPRRTPTFRRILRGLEARGASYAALAERPGWFVVEWIEPGYPTPDGSPWRQVIRPGQPIYGSKAMVAAVARRAAGRVVLA